MICLWFHYLQSKKKTVLVDGEVGLQCITTEDSLDRSFSVNGLTQAEPKRETMTRTPLTSCLPPRSQALCTSTCFNSHNSSTGLVSLVYQGEHRFREIL